MDPTAHDEPSSAEAAAQMQALAFDGLKRIGPYELGKKLGQGGMGAVFLAIDTRLKRNVALKILPKEKAENPTLVRRFKAEAQNAAQLKHENIVDIYETGEADGFLYIALEFIDGIDAHDLVNRRGVIPVKRSIDIIRQVARALQHANDKNIVHRDIKPANLLIRRDGVVKLADMGLARAVDEETETGITRAGCTVGTVDYMSPEQARDSKAADTRSDIYSLGCTWYHLLTGNPPFAEGSLTNKLRAHAQQPPPDPRSKNERVPDGVVAIMHRMLAKNPEHRYQSPAELLEDLEKPITRDVVTQKLFEDIEPTSSAASAPSPASPTRNALPAHSSTASSPPLSSGGSRATIPLDDDEEDLSEADLTRSEHPAPPRKKTSEKSSDKAEKGSSDKSSARNQAAAPGRPDNAQHDTSDDASDDADLHPHRRKRGQQKPPDSGSVGDASTAMNPTQRGSQETEDLPAKSYKLPPKTGKDGKPEAPPKPPPAWQVKLKPLLMTLGILVGVGVLLFLANLAQNYGNAVNTQPLALPVNPFDNAPPPPGPTTLTGDGTAPPATEAAAGSDAGTGSQVLTGSNEPHANSPSNTPSGTGGATTVGGNILPGTGQKAGPLPAWVEQPPALGALPVFNVRTGGKLAETDRQFDSLDAALQHMPATGASIILFDNGPFTLTSTELSTKVVSLRAAQGAQPIVVVKPVAEKPGLALNNGTLVLDGVHLLLEASQLPSANPWSVFELRGSDVWMRNSSIQLRGDRSTRTIAFQLQPAPKTESETTPPKVPQVYVDRSVIRGDQLVAVQFQAPVWEAMIRRSLLATDGPAPIVQIASEARAAAAALRRLFLIESTLSAQQRLIEASSNNQPDPVELQILVMGSLCSSWASDADNACLQVQNWPRKGSAGSSFKNLSWSAGGVGLLGWRTLLKVVGEDNADLKATAEWQRFWREPPESVLIGSHPWPALKSPDLSSVSVADWSLAGLADVIPNLEISGIKPGCDVAQLPLSAKSEPAPVAVTGAPRMPAAFASQANVVVDVNKQDLGKFVASKPWDDGTTFVVQGHSARTSSPIVIDGKRWQFVFQQLDGPPLIITPRPGSLRGSQEVSFISLKSGSVHLEHLTFQCVPTDISTIPGWFLNAEGGRFVLKNCRVQVPPSGGAKVRGLVRWTGASTPPAAGDQFSATSLIQDSLLVSHGSVLSLDLDSRALIVQNSVLFGRQQLLDFKVGQATTPCSSAVSILHSTIVSGEGFFRLQSTRQPGTQGALSRVELADSVFAPPLQEGANRAAPALLNYQGTVPLKEQVEWQETNTGYSFDLKSFLVLTPPPTPPVPAQDFQQQWVSFWGAEQIRNPLTGTGAVVFENPLPVSSFFKPGHFSLHPTSKARTIGAGGAPLGARLAALEAPLALGKPKSPATGTSPNSKKTRPQGF